MTLQGQHPTVTGQLSDIASVEWGRILNDIATATIVVTKCPDNCALFAEPFEDSVPARPWSHEVRIFRDNTVAFEGPIVRVRDRPTEIEILAYDMVGWVNRREVREAYTHTGDAVTIAANLLDTYFPPSDPWLMYQVLNTAVGSLDVEYDRAQYVIGQKWADLVKSGLNYSTLGRHILMFGQTPANVSTPYLLNIGDILGEAELLLDGLDFGTHAVCLGDGLAHGVGPTASDEALFGKVTYPPTRFPDVRDQADLVVLTEAFYDRKRDMKPRLVIPSGSTLSSSAEIYATGYELYSDVELVALPQLMCGFRYDIQVQEPYCHPGRYPMRLGQLKVAWTPEKGETVQVSFTDLGVLPE